MKKLFWTLALSLLVVGYAGAQTTVLVEAESFTNKGGWSLDQQFTDQMGSSYLIAHGIGKPVADAGTSVSIPKKGTWHVYVRTFNWCSPWTDEAPGRFKVAVNGKELNNELGLGKKWGWEYAGSVDISTGKNTTVALKDLTGFNGRCDAIVFSDKKDVSLPNDVKGLYAFRKQKLGIKTENAGNFDMVVVGGGTAGLSSAIKAARLGMKVALIQNRPVVGGNNSVELQVVASGKTNVEPYPRLGDIISEFGQIYRTPDKVKDAIAAEKNLTMFLNMHAFKVEMDGNKIKSVTAKDIATNQEKIFYSPLFVDCTGDANLGYMAGADYHVGREMRGVTHESLAPDRPDEITLGSSITWSSKKQKETVDFPLCTWAIQFTQFKDPDDAAEHVTRGSNWWETGFRYDQVEDAEFIRDYLLRAIYGNWSFLKNQSKKKAEYANYDLNVVGYLIAKRESRRLMGDVMVVQQDAEGAWTKFDDAMIYCSYSIDQHFPTPKNRYFFPGEEFISTMKHYWNDLGTPRRWLHDSDTNPPYYFPYRGLYSRNIDNLFMAGRQASVSHIALASTRVKKTTGMMGEVVGAAAAICKKYNCSPREVYTKHLDELKNTFK